MVSLVPKKTLLIVKGSSMPKTKQKLQQEIDSQTVDNIMMVKLMGGDMKTFNFMRALELWWGIKSENYSSKVTVNIYVNREMFSS